jgi:hypothetical protein
VRGSSLFLVAASLALLAAGCGKDSRASTGGGDPGKPVATADCGHTVCGSNFFIDSAPVGKCTVGQTCSVAMTLVATGEFHINDEYPYKFKADDAAEVRFLGTDPAGSAVFSKQAGSWQKSDEKKGVMTVTFQATSKAPRTIAGTFKLSVCSAQNCQLEQQQVSTTVAVQ